jgi:hypothetical protein
VTTTAVRGFWEVMYFKQLIETSNKSYDREVGKGDIERFICRKNIMKWLL